MKNIDYEIQKELEISMKKQPTDEEVEEMMSTSHTFLPLVKYDTLLMLFMKPHSSLTELVKKFGGQVKESTTDNLHTRLHEYQKRRLTKKTEKDGRFLWSLTSEGKERILYLLKRLNNEFYGSQGLKIYRQRKREEAIRRRGGDKYGRMDEKEVREEEDSQNK